MRTSFITISLRKLFIKSLINSYNNIKHCLINACGELITGLYIDRINRLTYRERLSGLHIKNRKLHMLISRKFTTTSNFKVPISKFDIANFIREGKHGLEQSFINKNKNQRKYLAANLESIN